MSQFLNFKDIEEHLKSIIFFEFLNDHQCLGIYELQIQ
jgi:hypothetical protein